MKLTSENFTYFSLCVEGLFYDMISVLPLSCPKSLNQSNNIPPYYLGLYSGIFIMYLQHSASKKDVKKGKVLFHALWLLYVLCLATFVFDIGVFIFLMVSKNEYLI